MPSEPMTHAELERVRTELDAGDLNIGNYTVERLLATIDFLAAELPRRRLHLAALEADLDAARRLIEAAWGIIANAGGGDWKTQFKSWQDAAARWRDEYMNKAAESAARKAGLDRE